MKLAHLFQKKSLIFNTSTFILEFLTTFLEEEEEEETSPLCILCMSMPQIVLPIFTHVVFK